MIAPGIESRTSILLAMLTVEVVVLAAFWLLYHLAVHRKVIKDGLVVAKLILTFWDVLGFAAGGLALSLMALLVSLFQSGARATLTRYASAVPFLMLGWFGIVYGAWRYLRLKAPPSEVEYDLAEKAAEQTVDTVTGWPPNPSFFYRGEAANFIVVSVLGAAMATYAVLSGTLTLISVWVPGMLPGEVEATLLRSAVDGSVKDGLLLLGLGGLSWVGGGILLRVVWKKLLKTRPLAINGRGVYAFYRGKPWRFLAWSNVNSISKLRLPEDTPFHPKIELQIDGAGVTLLITPAVRDFRRACHLISRYAREHSIKLRLIDKGKDTMTAHRKMVAPERYKELARTGVVTEIAEL